MTVVHVRVAQVAPVQEELRAVPVLAARAQGVDAFIVKPYSAAQLEVRIRTLMKAGRVRE